MGRYAIKVINDKELLCDNEGRAFDIEELVAGRDVLKRLGYFYKQGFKRWETAPLYPGERDKLERLKELAERIEGEIQDISAEVLCLLDERQDALESQQPRTDQA